MPAGSYPKTVPMFFWRMQRTRHSASQNQDGFPAWMGKHQPVLAVCGKIMVQTRAELVRERKAAEKGISWKQFFVEQGDF